MHDLQGRRVLITGAAGFIGANLARALVAAGASVHALLRASSEPWRLVDVAVHRHLADVNDLDAVEQAVGEARPEIVFHCAMPPGHPDEPAKRAQLLRTAVLGTTHLLEASARFACRFVHLGSSTEYGVGTGLVSESEPADPRSFRGAAKAAASLLCRRHALEAGQQVVVLRLFTVYGPWEGVDRLVPRATAAALGGGCLALTSMPYRRDWIFVGDVVDACLRAACADIPPGTIINVGTGIAATNHDVADIIEAVSGARLARRWDHPPRSVDELFRVADRSTARRLLGWEPTCTLRQGLTRTIEWAGARPPAVPRLA